MSRFFYVFLSLLVAACGGKATPAPAASAQTPSPDSPSEAPAPTIDAADEALIRALEKEMTVLVGAVKRAGENCDQLATAINGYVDDHGPRVRELSRQIDEDPERKARLDAQLDQRLGPTVEPLVPVIIACKEHEGVTRALGRMEAL